MRLKLISIVTIFALGNSVDVVAEPIRLGWQTSWAVQGQLVMGLREGGLAKGQGLDIEYVGFSYGAPLNQAALSGAVDVLLTADQPTVALLARSNDFQIVSRMMYNRVCVYAPADSDLTDLGSLSGKVVGGPIGAAAERVAARALSDGGATDVRFAQLDMAAQTSLLSAAGRSARRWPGVDGLFGFDPLPAYYEDAGLARMLACEPVVSVVVASREMVEQRPGELRDFLVAFAKSWLWYAENPSRANALFVAASGLEFTNEQLNKAASLEPNFTARTSDDLALNFSPTDLTSFREARDFLAEKGAVSAEFDISSRIIDGPLNAALRRLRE